MKKRGKKSSKKIIAIILVFLMTIGILPGPFAVGGSNIYAAGIDIISTVAGTESIGDGGAATDAQLNYPSRVAVDSEGNIYIADRANHVVRKVDTSGNISIVAGTGISGDNGDGGTAIDAELNFPSGVAVDNSGNIYIADTDNHRIRKVDSNGNISTVAGTGSNYIFFSLGDGGAATSAILNRPKGVVVDSSGNIYIADSNNHLIRKVDASSGNISTVAGTYTKSLSGIIQKLAGYSGDGGAATSAELHSPYDVAVDSAGNIFIADTSNNVIRMVDYNSGEISTVATGLNRPNGVAVHSSGNIYIADTGSERILKGVKVGNDWNFSTVAGTTGTPGFSGDGDEATSAKLNSPYDVAVDSNGNIFIADSYNYRIRKVDTSGYIGTVAGRDYGYNGDGIVATDAQLYYPYGVAVDSAGNIYIADTDNNRIRKVDTSGNISTVVGTGHEGYSGDEGLATDAELAYPEGVAVEERDGKVYIYIADSNNHVIRKVDCISGNISTVAGTGVDGYSGDGGLATDAQLADPTGVAVDNSGNIYIADNNNHVIRKVDYTSKEISTVAGIGGVDGYNGDGIVATDAQLYYPYGVAVDSAGNIYIADTDNNRIRKVDTSGNISTVVGTGHEGYSGDEGLATDAELACPEGVAVEERDGKVYIYIADSNNHVIRKVDCISGNISTVAGTGVDGYWGDGGAATDAELYYPYGVAVDSNGNIYIADCDNHMIRMIDIYGTIEISEDQPMAEGNLNGRTITVTINTGDNFAVTLDNDNFRLNNAPTGTIIESVNRIDNTHASVVLYYDGTDFDEDVNDLNLTVLASGLIGDHDITADNTLTITCEVGEIEVWGNGVMILNGNMPAPFDNTFFGTTDIIGGAIEKTFTIKSTGTDTLNISDISIGGPFASDFMVTTNPSSEVPTGESTAFTVRFDPSMIGPIFATIDIDSDSLPYSIAIQGDGYFIGPEIDVQVNGNSTDFGNININSGSVTKTFTIINDGFLDLFLIGNPIVSISGTDAADFTITQPNLPLIPSGGTTDFEVTFAPSTAGIKTVMISILNNDIDESIYDITLQGTGVTPTTYTVTFEANGGSSVSDITDVVSGSIINKPADPTRTGYTFDGWYKESGLINAWDFVSDTVTENTTLYAKWTAVPPTTYTVTFEANGGSSLSDITDVASGSTINKPVDPTQTNYTFGGWYKESGLTNEWNFATDTVTADTTLYAKWTEVAPTTYTVTFEENGGSSVSDITDVASGSIINKPSDPTKAGYTFYGWYKESELTNAWDFASDTVTENITLYAKWTAVTPTTYTVIFQENGGSSVSDITDVASDSTISNPADPTRTGYTFDGWYKESGLTNEWNFATDTVTADTTLYAKWTEVAPTTYTVTFEENGGSSVSDITDVASGSIINKPSDPTKTGYTFDGWYKEIGLTNPWNFGSDTVTENTTLYAKWTADVVSAPEIDIQGNGHSIVNGDTTPSTTDNTDFGTLNKNGGSVTKTFTIENKGSSDLNLGGNGKPIISISGPHAADFKLPTQPNALVTSGAAITFEINFNPSSTGTRTANISIENDDRDENPYNFTIQGRGKSSQSSGNTNSGNTNNTPTPEPTTKLVTNKDGSVGIIVSNPVVDVGNKEVKVELSSKDLNNAFEAAKAKELNQIQLEIPKQKDANGYQVEFPKEVLEADKEKEIEIRTHIGTVTLPGNMFDNEESGNSSNTSLSFKEVDKENDDTFKKLDDTIKEEIGGRTVIEISRLENGKIKRWENNNAPVKISIPYTPTKEELDDDNYENITVWYIDGEGNAIKVTSGRYNSDTGMVEFEVTHFSIYAIGYSNITFDDLDAYPWAKHQIEILAAKGITNGTGNNNYSPGAKITRADFLTLLIRTLQLSADFENNFEDVKEADYYYKAVGIAKELGITGGDGNNKFNPKEYITREDMMVFTARSLRIKGLIHGTSNHSILDRYTDKSQIATYAMDSVTSLVNNQIIQGSNHRINPKGNTTRAEAAVVLYKIYNMK